MDREFEDFAVDEAKVCSHNRLQLEGAMDLSREVSARDIAAFPTEPEGVLCYPVNADSDEADGSESDDASPTPSALRVRWEHLGRTASDHSAASQHLPIIYNPKCVEEGCNKDANVGMVVCSICDGHLHRGCGTLLDDNDEECTERRCSACASRGKGKRRVRS